VLFNLCKYGFVVSEVSDPFGRRGREILKRMIAELPPETRRITLMLLEEIERLGERIEEIEGRMREVFSGGGRAPSEHPRGWVHSGGGYSP